MQFEDSNERTIGIDMFETNINEKVEFSFTKVPFIPGREMRQLWFLILIGFYIHLYASSGSTSVCVDL
jgi:hypothetical protein